MRKGSILNQFARSGAISCQCADANSDSYSRGDNDHRCEFLDFHTHPQPYRKFQHARRSDEHHLVT